MRSDDLPLLISAEALASVREDRAGTDNPGRPLCIVDFRGSGLQFRLGHIPGAVNLPVKTVYDRVDGVSGRLPPIEEVVSGLEGAGLGTDATVVVYDDDDGLWAARLFWVLEYLGHNDVHILDGGYAGWKARDLEISRESEDPVPGRFAIDLRPERYASTEWMLDAIENDRIAMIDARSPEEYAGEKSYSDRPGHIPGAINIEWTSNLGPDENSRLLPPRELESMFAQVGIEHDREVVTYCQAGVRAAHTYLALRVAGYRRIRMYDDSWEVWGNRDDTPIETGEGSPDA